MKIRYYVSGIGYDNNDCVTDDEWDFGDFDTYEEAYNLFVQLQCIGVSSFFTESKSNVYQMLLQLEKCEETDDYIECVDVKNEWWIENPNFKKEISMKKFEVVVHYEGAINYEVEAQTEDEAKQIAEKMFGNESDTIIAAEITDCGICDCWEMEE